MFDFIIVGQGIAGSVLAITLLKKGFTVCVIDKPNLSLSSKVAAGIWNPVVFKRLTKSWLADAIVPELIQFYSDFETETGSKFLYHKNIIKPFSQEQEKELWLKKAQSENQFLENTIYSNFNLSDLDVIDSYSNVLNAGNIDMIEFLNQTKKYLIVQQSFIEEEFEHQALSITENNITYKNNTATTIIFCEGHLINKNPFFNFIPMKPAKGEILVIECEHLNLINSILNKGVFILPLGNNLYKVGATYEWDNLNDLPSENAKLELEKKLALVISVPYKIISHQAGVRPSVIDRRPVIGSNPNHNNCFVFNGFGTKAVMLAPYFANHLSEHFANKTPLSPEVNCSRFI